MLIALFSLPNVLLKLKHYFFSGESAKSMELAVNWHSSLLTSVISSRPNLLDSKSHLRPTTTTINLAPLTSTSLHRSSHHSVHTNTKRPSSSSTTTTTTMSAVIAQEVLPPVLDSTSEQPPLFDGTTRLYTSYICPYAQRVWITRNYKGLQDKIKLVPLDLGNRPAWYKEKVYHENKVPSLEHNNEVKGESLDLVKYIDSNFEGPSLLPKDPAKREFVDELLAYTDKFGSGLFAAAKGHGDAGAPFDYLETALQKFNDGPFFLGREFSQADVAYAPFVERFHPLLLDVKNYDITVGRPNLKAWIEALDTVEAYKQTKWDPEELVSSLKKRLQLS